MDLILERLQLRRSLRHREHRRPIRPQRNPNRLPRRPCAANQLLDRHTTNEMLPTKFGPTLHVQHASTWHSIAMTEPGSTKPRTPPPSPGKGVKTQPAKGVSFPPAPTGPSSVAKAVAQLGGVSERASNRAAGRSRRPPWRDGSATGWRDGDCFRRASSNAPSFADRNWRVVRRDSQAIDYAVCASAGEAGASTRVPARTSTASGGRSGYPAGTNECGPVMDA